jgi:PDZ domain-containing protein
MSNRHPGEVVRLTVRAGREARQVTVKTIADPADRRRALIGLFPGQASQVRLPLEVRIDAGGVGGPSAGLAFALDLMEELGRDVDHGYRVAATGAIDLDGSVRSIGGVKQKTLGARQADVDVFLVPAGENARDARRYADGLRVIPVKTFPQALQALATLPPKA